MAVKKNGGVLVLLEKPPSLTKYYPRLLVLWLLGDEMRSAVLILAYNRADTFVQLLELVIKADPPESMFSAMGRGHHKMCVNNKESEEQSSHLC